MICSKRLRMLRKFFFFSAAVVIGIGLTFVPARPARALTFNVTNLNDSGPGSLRDAVNQANLNPGLDGIVVMIPGIIVLTSGPIVVTDNVDIFGSGTAICHITSNGAGRMFTINIPTPGGAVSMHNLTLFGGNVSTSGGAVHSNANLTFINVDVTENHADINGGGIYVDANFITTGGVFWFNTAGQNGGGFYVTVNGLLTTNGTLFK